jgi:hypothetical protein
MPINYWPTCCRHRCLSRVVPDGMRHDRCGPPRSRLSSSASTALRSRPQPADRWKGKRDSLRGLLLRLAKRRNGTSFAVRPAGGFNGAFPATVIPPIARTCTETGPAVFRGPGFFHLDTDITKKFFIREQKNIELDAVQQHAQSRELPAPAASITSVHSAPLPAIFPHPPALTVRDKGDPGNRPRHRSNGQAQILSRWQQQRLPCQGSAADSSPRFLDGSGQSRAVRRLVFA